MRTIIFSLVLTFFSCNKNRMTEVSGTVVEYATGKPIDDVRVSLQDGLASTDPLVQGGQGTGDKSSTFTDENGSFSVAISGEWPAHLVVSHDEYWKYENLVQGAALSSKGYSNGTKNKNEIFELKAKARFAAVLKSLNSMADSLLYYELNQNLTKKYVGDKVFYGKGPFAITTLSQGRIAIGNDYFRYMIKYKRSKSWHMIIDSVYIKKGETFRDTIYY